MPPAARGPAGHGPNPPRFAWPGDARLALPFVVNVEEGAELAPTSGDERNEPSCEAREEVVCHPDPCMESHHA
jgi:hypothetical protein